MRSLAHDFAHGNFPVMRDRVEASLLRHTQPRHPVRAVTINPFHLVNFLPGGLHEVA